MYYYIDPHASKTSNRMNSRSWLQPVFIGKALLQGASSCTRELALHIYRELALRTYRELDLCMYRELALYMRELDLTPRSWLSIPGS